MCNAHAAATQPPVPHSRSVRAANVGRAFSSSSRPRRPGSPGNARVSRANAGTNFGDEKKKNKKIHKTYTIIILTADY